MSKKQQYENSPLAAGLLALLGDIEAIKKRYPKNEQDNEETLEARIALRFFKYLFSRLHNQILPAFSERATPGFLDALKFRSVPGLYRDRGYLTQAIRHPMIFDLFQAIIQRIETAPHDLPELMPFFDPQALPNSNILNFAFKLQTIPNPARPDAESYEYSIQQGDTVSTENLQTRYNQLPGELLSAIDLYFQTYADTKHVINEKKQASVLCAFHAAELEQIRACLSLTIDNCDLSAANPEQKVQKLLAEIERRQTYSDDNQRLQSFLLDKQNAYINSTVKTLLSAYPDMCEGIDPDYGDFPLPELIINDSDFFDNLVFFPLKKGLDLYVEAALSSLVQHHQNNQQVLRSLTERLPIATEAWKLSQQSACQSSASALRRKLDVHQDRLLVIDDERQRVSNSHSQDCSELAHQLNYMNELMNELSPMSDCISSLLVEAKQLSLLPEDVLPWDKKGSLQSCLNRIVESFNETASLVSQHIDNTQKALLRTRDACQTRLQKAQSDAAFSASMRSTQPDILRQLLLEQRAQHQHLDEEHKSLNAERVRLDQLLASQSQALDKLNDTNGNLNALIAGVQAQINVFKTNEKALCSALSKQLNITDSSARTDAVIKATHHFLIRSNQSAEESLHMLQDVKGMLREAHTIPFQQIDEHLKNNYRSISCSSFADLLSVLKLHKPPADKSPACSSSSPLPAIDWATFRDRQDKLFRRKPQAHEYKQALELLHSHIDSQETRLQRTIAVKSLKNEWSTLQENLALSSEREAALQQEQRHNHTQNITLMTQYNSLADQAREIEPLLKQIPIELQQLSDSIQALEQLLTLMDSLASARRDIDLLDQTDRHFANDDSLVATIIKHRQTCVGLSQQIKALAQAVTSLANSALWQERVDSLKPLFIATRKHLQDNISNKARLSEAFVQAALSAIEGRIQTIQQDLELMHEPLAQPILDLLTRFQSIPGLLQHPAMLVQRLSGYQAELQNEFFNQTITNLQDKAGKLQALVTELDAHLMEKRGLIIQQLNHLCQEQAARIAALTYHENRDEQSDITDNLANIRRSIDIFPADNILDLLGEQITATLKAEQDNVRTLLSLHEQIHQSILQRIRARQDSVARYRAGLERYQGTRHQQYQFKDAVFSADRRRREDFITLLGQDLDAYDRSGNSQALLTRIQAGVEQFPGIHFRSLLNKIASDVRDADRRKPTNYALLPIVDPNAHVERAQILARIIFSPEDDDVYNDDQLPQIMALHFQLSQVRNYTRDLECTAAIRNAINNLTDKLHDDLAEFVIRHRKVLPSEAEYNAFKSRFTERLHSEDALLHQQDNSWKMNIANLLIGVLSLGVALLARVVYSNWKHGYTRLFFDKTEEQMQFEAVEERLNNWTAPAA